MPPRTLVSALANSDAANKDNHHVEKVRWLECFSGKENFSEFCEATDPAGNLESNSSPAYKEYQDRLRTIALRKEGFEKAEIAESIGRPAKFVQTWWRKEPKEVPKPAGVHDYLKTEFWRDIEIIRGFGKGQGIYEDALATTEWVQPMADGREFRNGGGYRLKYDKEGRMRPQGNQNAKDGVIPGRLPKLDKLIQRVMVEQGIDDRVLKRPGLLWYPDGNSDAIVHRHEAWTALMSFGSPRILTIDGQPVLLRDGDLIIFGTQRHGVPKMCGEGSTFDEYGGRMSVVMFFMPTGQQSSGAAPWQAIHDGPSSKASGMLQNAHLGYQAQASNFHQMASQSTEMQHLMELGFGEAEAAAALKHTGFDLALAAEALLSGNGALLLSHACDPNDRSSQTSALLRRLDEVQKAKVVQPLSTELDWEEHAILEQLQELQQDMGGVGADCQFAHLQEMIDAEDAEEWDGRGDLMVREWRRLHLHIEQQDAATIYALGCGSLLEKAFFELLSLHSIRVLYDFRSNPEQGPSHLKPSHLEGACKRHSLHYRSAPLGREGAYGILKHLREDEGRNLLAELVWWARRKRTAFLGAEEDWRQDHRSAIASRLQQAGHCVKHVEGGRLIEHPSDFEMPDFIVGEEARLRTLEKQRFAGEGRVTKSTSRSTEAVAQKLTQPQKVIDAGAELRKANTQAELCRVQRRLADLERRSDSADSALGPKLLHVNKWIKAEAEQQKVNLAAGKTKDGKDKSQLTAGGPAPSYSWTSSGGTAGGNPDFSASSAAGSPELQVECRSCNTTLPWSQLADGDGSCSQCRAQGSSDATTAETEASEAVHELEPMNPIDVVPIEKAEPAPCNRWSKRRFQNASEGAV